MTESLWRRFYILATKTDPEAGIKPWQVAVGVSIAVASFPILGWLYWHGQNNSVRDAAMALIAIGMWVFIPARILEHFQRANLKAAKIIPEED